MRSADQRMLAVVLAGFWLGLPATLSANPRLPIEETSNASPVEQAFSARASAPLKLFGYDLFAATPLASKQVPAGAAQADYVLGIGDSLTVTLRGQINASRRAVIDSEGQLVIDEVPPVSAAGRTLGELRADLSRAVSAAHPNVDTFVSLSEVRQIGVVVLGAVGRPGRVDLNSYATTYDALAAAGGVTRDGSLRRIVLTRDGTTTAVDLYGLLMTGGGGGTERLRDGDRLLVPPLGPAVGVAGPVKRPGIYELPADRTRLSMSDLRDQAGGLIRPSNAAALRLGLRPDGTEEAVDVDDPAAAIFGDGDLLVLAPQREDRKGTVRIEGHVFRPGARSLTGAQTLGAALKESDLKPGAYRPVALIASPSPKGAKALRAVDLGAVLSGRDDAVLADGDEAIVLGEPDIAFLTSEPVLAVLRGDGTGDQPQCRGLTLLARAMAADPDGPMARGPQALAALNLAGPNDPCPPVYDRWPDALSFLLDHSALVMNAGARSGFYPRVNGGGDIVDEAGPRVELTGHVRHPGVRPLPKSGGLRGLLANGTEIADGAYPLFGLIERHERKTVDTTDIPFSPRDVASGKAERKLTDGDIVHLFADADVRALDRPAKPEKDKKEEDNNLDEATMRTLRDHAVILRGAVRRPGSYPVADTGSVESLLAAAGGLAANADDRGAEATFARGEERRRALDLTRAADRRVLLGPGDSLRVNTTDARLEAGTVTVAGEVRHPGAFEILRGERLSSVIARAGGLTEDAYPAGAVFTRAAERTRQKAEFDKGAHELEKTLESGTIKGEEATFARQLATRLRDTEPLGRIVVQANPAAFKDHPEDDMPLETGDRLYIPKRTPVVTVAGEVQSPGALRFATGTPAEDYIAQAGGTTARADESRAFLLLPDGKAQPLALSSWNYGIRAVPPGSTIVVPLDTRPYGFLDALKDIGGILSQMAITAASISVISR